MNVVLVDDESLFVTLYSKYLKNIENINIHAVLDSTLALDKIIDLEPDVIITDLNMPGIDGIQLVKMIRNHDTSMHIPIIMLTSESDLKLKERALAVGVDMFLDKSIDQVELVNYVVELVSPT